ncbi:MAG: carboxyltransferase domain-containing protein [Nocardioides sp.]
MEPLTTHSAGPRALLIELPLTEPGPAAAAAQQLAAWLRGHNLAAEVIPAARTVLCDGIDDLAALLAALRQLPSDRAGTYSGAPAANVASFAPGSLPPEGSSDVVVVPVTYDGADLARVAEHWRVDPAEVVRRHTGVEFVVAFCGFAPGFAYLAGLPDEWAVPRLGDPRARVPRGAVAIADRWCAVYPRSSPGGWLILGHTELEVFDPERQPPALLSPGARVRFVAVGGAR